MDLTDKSTGQAVATSVLSGQQSIYTDHLLLTLLPTLGNLQVQVLTILHYQKTVVLRLKQTSKYLKTMVVYTSLVLTNLVTSRLVHSLRIENRTGAITFTGTVTISEVEFLKLKGGDVVVTGFDASNTLGGANSSDSKLPTQKAVRDYITNNLGPYINKPYSTNAVPRALVELTDSGKISIDQIPALRPLKCLHCCKPSSKNFSEGALAGDIAIQQDTSQSFILNNDNDSLFLAFHVDPTCIYYW